jgi:N-acetyl-gamma-glutamyl-phosphate reductase
MDRGILSTLYVTLSKKMKTEEVLDLFLDAYRGEPFVRIYPKGKLPNTRDVRGSNYCDIGVVIGGDGRMVIVTAIDNLVKGASGQAIQNMNIMLGFPETMGLNVLPLSP